MNAFVLLLGAIAGEVVATTSLKFSQGFTKPIPVVLVIVGYGIAFYLFSLALKSIPLGTAYALWSGLGVVLTAVAGIILWHEAFDLWKVVGLVFIIVGVICINLLSSVPTA